MQYEKTRIIAFSGGKLRLGGGEEFQPPPLYKTLASIPIFVIFPGPSSFLASFAPPSRHFFPLCHVLLLSLTLKFIQEVECIYTQGDAGSLGPVMCETATVVSHITGPISFGSRALTRHGITYIYSCHTCNTHTVCMQVFHAIAYLEHSQVHSY